MAKSKGIDFLNIDGIDIIRKTAVSISGGALPKGYQVYLDIDFVIQDTSWDAIKKFLATSSSITVRLQKTMRGQVYANGNTVYGLSPEALNKMKESDKPVRVNISDIDDINAFMGAEEKINMHVRFLKEKHTVEELQAIIEQLEAI